MYPGVGKSGSPAPKPITGRPAALSALALASTASVADSVIAPTRREMRRAGSVMTPYCHCRSAAPVIAGLGGSTPQRRATTLHPLVAVHFTGPAQPHGLTRPAPGSAARGGTANPARPSQGSSSIG